MRKALPYLLVGLGLSLLYVKPTLAQDFTLYAPPLYDEFRVPYAACLWDDCYPRLYLWPDTGIHNLNLVGVPFLIQSPPAQAWTAVQGARSTHMLSMNYWGYAPSGVWDLADSLTYSGYNDAVTSHFAPDSLTTIKGGSAWIDTVANGVYTGTASLIASNPLWARDDTLKSGFTLVHRDFTAASP